MKRNVPSSSSNKFKVGKVKKRSEKVGKVKVEKVRKVKVKKSKSEKVKKLKIYLTFMHCRFTSFLQDCINYQRKTRQSMA